MIILTLLSLLNNTDFRFLKILNFPRIQFFIAFFIAIILLVIIIKKWKWFDFILLLFIITGIGIHASFLINYTPFVEVDVPKANSNKENNKFSLLLSNIKMSNRNAKPFLDLIAVKEPDLILVMEVDNWWDNKLQLLKKEYPFSHHTVNDDAYGMVLLSKLPLKNLKVDYLNNKNVPSFESTVQLNYNKSFKLHCIHPVPPTHFNELPDNENQQEIALKKLGNSIEKEKKPTVVAGDLNDVVWSYVDKLTGTRNILFDVRKGRGFYNSYDATNILMSWPLDHVFVSKEFSLKSIERLPKIGSDHYPILVEIILN